MKQLLVGAVLTAVVTFAIVQATVPGAAFAAPGCPWAARPFPDPGVRVPVVGSMVIGGIGLRTPTFQGWLPDIESEASRSLQHGPAFYPQYMRWNNGRVNHLPGQGGTVAMLGHRTTRTHPFCLVASIHAGNLAVVKMRYGTFVYREVTKVSLLADNWSAFEWPARYDPSSKNWNKGIKPEYLVIGACDPPHSAVRRMNVIFKLVKVRRA
jgi:sortase (surface protein transpeptidase)